LSAGSDGGFGADDSCLRGVFLNISHRGRRGGGGRSNGNASGRDRGLSGSRLSIEHLVQLGLHPAIAVACRGNGRAGPSRRADSSDAIPNQAFRTRMASDASSFTDEILIPGFVVRIDDIGDAVARGL